MCFKILLHFQAPMSELGLGLGPKFPELYQNVMVHRGLKAAIWGLPRLSWDHLRLYKTNLKSAHMKLAVTLNELS